MQHCVVCVDPVSLLVLEIDQSGPQGSALLGASSAKFVGRPLGQWIVDPGREDLARMLSVALRSAEPRRFRASIRPAEGTLIAVELHVASRVKARNETVLQISVAILSPTVQSATTPNKSADKFKQKLTA